jgi:hypothetical protein
MIVAVVHKEVRPRKLNTIICPGPSRIMGDGKLGSQARPVNSSPKIELTTVLPSALIALPKMAKLTLWSRTSLREGSAGISRWSPSPLSSSSGLLLTVLRQTTDKHWQCVCLLHCAGALKSLSHRADLTWQGKWQGMCPIAHPPQTQEPMFMLKLDSSQRDGESQQSLHFGGWQFRKDVVRVARSDAWLRYWIAGANVMNKYLTDVGEATSWLWQNGSFDPAVVGLKRCWT